MEIRLYIGAHRTASNHMDAMLSDNKDLLLEQGILYTHPSRTIRRISRAQQSLSSGAPLKELQEHLIASLTHGQQIDKVVIINPNILGALTRPFGKELFYPRTSGLIKQLQTVFQGIPLRLFISVRNPATFIPSCYAESMLTASFNSFADFTTDVNLANLKWSSLLHRAQGKHETLPMTVWRYEDYPYIWRDVAQAITGMENGQDLVGSTERIASSLTLRGAQLFYRYIEEHPPRTKESFENTKRAFLEKFPSSPNEIAGPDWPAELVRTLTHKYDDDWYYIERMEGVQTIQPRRFDEA